MESERNCLQRLEGLSSILLARAHIHNYKTATVVHYKPSHTIIYYLLTRVRRETQKHILTTNLLYQQTFY